MRVGQPGSACILPPPPFSPQRDHLSYGQLLCDKPQGVSQLLLWTSLRKSLMGHFPSPSHDGPDQHDSPQPPWGRTLRYLSIHYTCLSLSTFCLLQSVHVAWSQPYHAIPLLQALQGAAVMHLLPDRRLTSTSFPPEQLMWQHPHWDPPLIL